MNQAADRLERLLAASRCGARTRGGTPCSALAMPNGRCRAHGGLSPGGGGGAANGRFVDGFWTREAIEERRFISLLLNGNLGGKP